MKKNRKTNGGLARNDKRIIADKLKGKNISYTQVVNVFSNRAVDPDKAILIRKEAIKIIAKRKKELKKLLPKRKNIKTSKVLKND